MCIEGKFFVEPNSKQSKFLQRPKDSMANGHGLVDRGLTIIKVYDFGLIYTKGN